MGKALYRKYRSRALSEIVGQEHITTTLTNALKAGKIAHAYLLTGPRGVGKTSIARILAHEINGLTYSEDPHFDIIEIDAASNNGVEDVRDLRDKILSAPASAKYKVFIIDEVHMLSKAAFNALLKTLEEPPAHVVFILATTESHKLPETIISRTQRYSFRPVPLDKVVAHLRNIASQEKIVIDNAALQLIAEHGEGSFRDSISLLDQASSISEEITREQVEVLLGRAPASQISTLCSALANRATVQALEGMRHLLEQGYEPAMIAMQISAQLRSELLEGKHVMAAEDIMSLLRDLLDVPPAHNPKALLELTLMKWSTPITAMARNSTEVSQVSQAEEHTHHAKDTVPPATRDIDTANLSEHPVVTPGADPQTAKGNETSTLEPLQEPSPTTQNEAIPSEPAKTSDAAQTVEDVSDLWHAVLQQLKKTHNTLYGIARMARPMLQDDLLTLELTFAFHKKRLSEPANEAIIAKLVDSQRGKPTRISCITVQKVSAKPVNETVATISNIFGGAELLES
ncbi:DNA polymerase III subunit gamma/tau [Candidatus Saccharibacteria bacterium]|nr:DNA polymerase III subunit gamma/tau [Candidatus Saccharibacteria bacterium]